MLQEDLFQVKALKEELNELGAYFASQRNMKAARFCYVLLRMSSHIVPKEAEHLEGLYKVCTRSMAAHQPPAACKTSSLPSSMCHVQKKNLGAAPTACRSARVGSPLCRVQAAFEKLYILLEDSLWALQPEKQQEDEQAEAALETE
jgi:hypothetical protein